MNKSQERYENNKLINAKTNCLVYKRAKEESGKRFNLPYRLARMRLREFGFSDAEINAFVFNNHEEESMFK
jgi:hypothetical protein